VQDRKFICPCYRHERDIAETGHCICHLFVGEDYEPVELEPPPVREEGSPWPYITVYGAYWCKDTVRTITLLNRRGIPYVFVDIDNDLEGAKKVQGWNRGNFSTPTLDIGPTQGANRRIVSVPSDEELAELLGFVL
jgi:glutaredoxin